MNLPKKPAANMHYNALSNLLIPCPPLFTTESNHIQLKLAPVSYNHRVIRMLRREAQIEIPVTFDSRARIFFLRSHQPSSASTFRNDYANKSNPSCGNARSHRKNSS